jgi:hypothetical protein
MSSYWGGFVPPEFQVPLRLDGDGFHLRMLTVNDLVKDYDAVMSSAARLKGLMRPGSTWPDGLTLEDDLIDLGWHQREFRLRRSFCYTMMSPDESVCLGCCYIYPSEKSDFDAKVFWWVRTSALAGGFDERLGTAFRGWLRDCWPFKRVASPGRDISWDEWHAAS